MDGNKGIGCQRGVGLVEVLAALLVLAVGVLGYAGLQLAALKGASAAQTRARAVMLARSALELMRVNPAGGWVDGDWSQAGIVAGSPPPDRTGCIARPCDSAAMRAWEVRQLTWQAANDLPSGRIAVAPCTSAGTGETSSCVLVSWGGQSTVSCLDEKRTGDPPTGIGGGLNCVVLAGGR